MKYIGIDPGKSGAIAIIDQQICFPIDNVEVYDMPLLPDKKRIDVQSIFKVLYDIKEKSKVKCVLEKSQTMPGQGGISNFSYGKTYGSLLTILELLNINFKEVHPMTWKKAFGLTSKKGVKKVNKKLASLKEACKLFPEMKKIFHTKRGRLLDGRCEALLLAEYCVRISKVKRMKRN